MNVNLIERIREKWGTIKIIDDIKGYNIAIDDDLCRERNVSMFWIPFNDFKTNVQTHMIFLSTEVAQLPGHMIRFALYHELGHIMQFYGVVNTSDDHYIDEAYADQYAMKQLGLSVDDVMNIMLSTCGLLAPKHDIDEEQLIARFAALIKLENGIS